MAYDFTKLSEVEELEAAPEGAKVLIETNGEIKRSPAPSSGGGGGYDAIFLINQNDDEVLMTVGDYDTIYSKMGFGESDPEPINAMIMLDGVNNNSINWCPALVSYFPQSAWQEEYRDCIVFSAASDYSSEAFQSWYKLEVLLHYDNSVTWHIETSG